MAAPTLPGEPGAPPVGLFRHKGVLRVRRRGLRFRLRGLTCCDGHSVEVHGRVREKGEHCTYRRHPGDPMCGAYLLIMLMPAGPGEHRATDSAAQAQQGGWRRNRWFWVADTNVEELDAIEAAGLDAEEIIERFGGLFP